MFWFWKPLSTAQRSCLAVRIDDDCAECREGPMSRLQQKLVRISESSCTAVPC